MILTDYGKSQFLKGKLNYKFASLDDDDVVYDILSGSSGTNISSSNARSEISYYPVLEAFEICSSSGEPYISNICDYNLSNNKVPYVLTESNSSISLNVMFNDDLNYVLESNDVDESLKNDVLNSLENGDIKESDLYKYDAIEIKSKVYGGDDEISHQYGSMIKVKRTDTNDYLLIKKISDTDYSVGEYIKTDKNSDSTFYEYLRIQIPIDMDVEDIKHVIDPIFKNSKYGMKTLSGSIQIIKNGSGGLRINRGKDNVGTNRKKSPF